MNVVLFAINTNHIYFSLNVKKKTYKRENYVYY